MVEFRQKKKVLIGYSIVSPLHLINFLTYLESINDREKFAEIYVFISVYWSKIIIPERYLKFCRSKGIQVVSCDIIKNQILDSFNNHNVELVCVKTPSIKMMLKSLLNKEFTISKIVIVDEGISSYASWRHTLSASLRELGFFYSCRFLLLKFIIFILLFFYHNILNKYSAFNLEDLSINTSYRDNFCLVLKEIYENKNKNEKENENILFCSQPWVDLGVITENDYREYLTNLINTLAIRNYKMIIKKHPADIKFDYSGFEVVHFDGIVEELIYNNRYRAILSASSTSSLLAPACFGCDSYTISFEGVKIKDSKLKLLFKKYCKDIESLL